MIYSCNHRQRIICTESLDLASCGFAQQDRGCVGCIDIDADEA